jgi:7-carboxy-7-deazaguanine synthase
MKKLRIAEIFGPTIQGEGRHVGVPCYFIRIGGCDYECSWCDSLHAVLPEYVRGLPRLTLDEIIHDLVSLGGAAQWVVLSGGNPALYDLTELVSDLQEGEFKVMVETQGTMYKPWLADVDELCVSPKGPSAGIGTEEQSLQRLHDFMHCNGILEHRSVYLKVPVFSEEDYEFARRVRQSYQGIELYLSVGNPLPPRPPYGDSTSVHILRSTLLARTRELAEKIFEDRDPLMQSVRILPQQHVLMWGNTRAK